VARKMPTTKSWIDNCTEQNSTLSYWPPFRAFWLHMTMTMRTHPSTKTRLCSYPRLHRAQTRVTLSPPYVKIWAGMASIAKR